MASVNNNTIVVVNTVGPIVVEAWIDHPNGTCLNLQYRHARRDQYFLILLLLVTALVREILQDRL